ncbi:MAG: hypothetical protein F4206_03395 [Gammaproteobacteria bacterium]|nr:hypothetical protein [Gammaproteobacteria bacterium]
MNNETTQKELKGLDAMLELTKDRLKEQADDRRLLTMKAGIMFVIGSYIVTGELQPLNWYSGIAYLCTFVSMVCGLVAIYAKTDLTLKLLDLKEALDDKGYENGLAWILDTGIYVCDENAKKSNRVATVFNVGIGALGLAILLDFIAGHVLPALSPA